jgi:UDP-N-acetyl-D-mannosaminuronic acid dehydrogenase
VIAVEPNITKSPIEKCELTSKNVAINEAHVHVLLVEHNEFEGLIIDSEFVVDSVGVL